MSYTIDEELAFVHKRIGQISPFSQFVTVTENLQDVQYHMETTNAAIVEIVDSLARVVQLIQAIREEKGNATDSGTVFIRK